MLSRYRKEKKPITEDQLVTVPLLVKGLALLVLVLVLPLELILRGTIEDVGERIVLHIQKSRTESSDNFFRYLSYIANNVFLLAVAPALYHIYDPRRAIRLILIWCFSMYLGSLISLIYGEPRPYWSDKDIKGISCDNGFGLPSPECMLGTVVYGSLSVEFFQKKDKWIKTIVYSCTYIILGTLGYGGIYMGEHYPHQVFISYCYGYVFIIICFAFDKKIMNLTMKSCFRYKANKKYSVYWYIGTLFLLLGAIAIYDEITLTSNIDIRWISNASKDCNLKNDVGGSTSFYRSAWIFYNFGLVAGSMHLSKKLTMFWWLTDYWRRWVRFAISVGFSLGVYYLFGNSYLSFT